MYSFTATAATIVSRRRLLLLSLIILVNIAAASGSINYGEFVANFDVVAEDDSTPEFAKKRSGISKRMSGHSMFSHLQEHGRGALIQDLSGGGGGGGAGGDTNQLLSQIRNTFKVELDRQAKSIKMDLIDTVKKLLRGEHVSTEKLGMVPGYETSPFTQVDERRQLNLKRSAGTEVNVAPGGGLSNSMRSLRARQTALGLLTTEGRGGIAEDEAKGEPTAVGSGTLHGSLLSLRGST